MKPTLEGGAEPGRADRAWPSPRPAQRVLLSIHGPKSDVVCEIPIPRGVGPGRPGPRVSNRTDRLPGLALEIVKIFQLFFRTVSPPRGFDVATCSLARAQRLLWAAARCPQSAYEAESVMPLYYPSDTVGAAWVT